MSLGNAGSWGKSSHSVGFEAGAWRGGCIGTVGPAELERTLVVIALGLWQGF